MLFQATWSVGTSYGGLRQPTQTHKHKESARSPPWGRRVKFSTLSPPASSSGSWLTRFLLDLLPTGLSPFLLWTRQSFPVLTPFPAGGLAGPSLSAPRHLSAACHSAGAAFSEEANEQTRASLLRVSFFSVAWTLLGAASSSGIHQNFGSPRTAFPPSSWLFCFS